jgi:hypothetical protein
VTRLAATVVGVALVVLSALALERPASAEPAASRIIDRTLSCSVALRAGVRKLEVQANAGLRLLEDRSKWKYLAGAGVGDSEASLGYVSAGNPKAPENGFTFPPERLGISERPKCRAAARIPFSRAGLAGGSASQLFDRYDCFPGGRVLVRIRAVFRSPTSLRRKRYQGGTFQLVAAGTVAKGQVAVRTLAGKPLAYAEVFESGTARLFTASSCVED